MYLYLRKTRAYHIFYAPTTDAAAFKPSREAPWCRPDIFNFEYIDSNGPPPPPEAGKGARYLWDILTAFHAPKSTFVERGTKYLLAAIALTGAETTAQPASIQIPTNLLIDKATQDALDCSNHYKMKQAQNNNASNKAADAQQACLAQMNELVNKVYALIEALSYVRSYHLHNLYRAKMQGNQSATAEADFEKITKKFNLGNTDETLAPLVAFLSSGVKGLMIYPGDKRTLSPLKLIHFMLVLRQEVDMEQPIQEPIWQRTQSLILDLIEGALFPDGLDIEDTSDPGTAWSKVECPKMALARAIELDFVHFCIQRDDNPDSEFFTSAPWELPEVKTLQIDVVDDRGRRASTVAP